MAVCCSVTQCVAVCCSVLQYICSQCTYRCTLALECGAVRCSALQCIAVCCSTFALNMMCKLFYNCSQNHDHNFVLGFKIARMFKNKTLRNSVLLIIPTTSVTHTSKDLMELRVHGEHGREDILVRRNQLSKILYEKSEQPSPKKVNILHITNSVIQTSRNPRVPTLSSNYYQL